MPVPNLFLGLLDSCQHDATLEREAQKNGQKPKLAGVVIPDIPMYNQFYPLSRWSTQRYRGPYTSIQNTQDMVNQLWQISNAAQTPIDFLSISGHGNVPPWGTTYSWFRIGSDEVTLQVLQ